LNGIESQLLLNVRKERKLWIFSEFATSSVNRGESSNTISERVRCSVSDPNYENPRDPRVQTLKSISTGMYFTRKRDDFHFDVVFFWDEIFSKSADQSEFCASS
jgi:hypothetical protein